MIYRALLLLLLLGLTGCDTLVPASNAPGVSGTIKARGVYTTLAVPGQYLDLPASGYLSYRNFAPGQTPAAVVVGYGDDSRNNNYGQPYQLRLLELPGRTVLQTLQSQVYEGKADVVDLPIRKTGQYELQLLIGQATVDTWDFTVVREGAADTPGGTNAPAAYAKGDFSVGMEDDQNPEAFRKYDDALLWSLTLAVHQALKQANPDDFAQIPAGHVLIQFDLGASGQVTAPQIQENTLSEAIGQFFLRALQKGAPYKPWRAEARAAAGADTRPMKVTFYYQ